MSAEKRYTIRERYQVEAEAEVWATSKQGAIKKFLAVAGTGSAYPLIWDEMFGSNQVGQTLATLDRDESGAPIQRIPGTA